MANSNTRYPFTTVWLMTGYTSRKLHVSKFKRQISSPFSELKFFSIITTNKATYIQNVSNFFHLYLSLYLFSGFLFRKTKHTYSNRQTAEHETIHIHQNLFRKITRKDKEVLFEECWRVWRKTWVFCVSFHLEERVTLLKSKHQTEKRR